jgi:ketosteroid isomerase-like protein
MSEDNVELVRRRFAAALVGDWQTALEALDPDVEIHDYDIPDAGGVYRGHEGYRDDAVVYRMRAGRIVRVDYFNDQARALDAVRRGA